MLSDVIGVCRDASDLTTIVTKASKTVSKRDVHLVDRSNHVVNSTLWGAEAEGFEDDGKFPVIAIKGARVSDFGGRSLNVGFNSVLTINPDIPEAHQLRGWFDNFGKNVETTSISESRAGGSEWYSDTFVVQKDCIAYTWMLTINSIDTNNLCLFVYQELVSMQMCVN